jgi:hypothetical protein
MKKYCHAAHDTYMGEYKGYFFLKLCLFVDMLTRPSCFLKGRRAARLQEAPMELRREPPDLYAYLV